MSNLKISTPSKEGIFHASKWLKHQVLLDVEEMEALFAHLPLFSLYNISEIVTEFITEKKIFLETYATYIQQLKEGEKIGDNLFRRMFSLVMSTTVEALYAMQIKEGAYLIKLLKPVVQMQQHQFLPSPLDGKIHPMVLSQESVSWGLQFSYPQIFQYPNPQEGETFVKIRHSPEFPNTALFESLVRWVRNFTVPATFIWEGKRVATSLRLGKKCLGWINRHPQLRRIYVSGL